MKKEALLFSYFKGPGDGLHLACSEDGYIWEALNNDSVFLKPAVGKDKLMRDPYIAQGPDGTFHLVWTSSWFEKGIGHASSKDLIHWSPQQFIPLMEHEKHARNCWAPEIFYDEAADQFLIYWATTITGRFPETDHTGDDGLNHRMYYTTTKDFKSFSEAKLLYDGGFNVIDASIVKDGDRYVMFLKNETLTPTEKNIRQVISKDLFSGFGVPGKPITGSYWAEGPSAVKLNNEWILYFDKYRLHQMGAARSVDLVNWEDISHLVKFPQGTQHGAVFKVPEEIAAKLKAL